MNPDSSKGEISLIYYGTIAEFNPVVIPWISLQMKNITKFLSIIKIVAKIDIRSTIIIEKCLGIYLSK